MRAAPPGYSLLELLVVLAIIGLIATVAVPIVTTSVDRATLTADARAVATQLRAWREAALDRQMEVEVARDGAGGLAASTGERLNVAVATSVEIVGAKDFMIAADGTASARLRLSRGDASVVIAIHRLTGRISIEPAP